MKVIIKPSQIDGLIDNGVNPVEIYFKIFHPKILKRYYHSSYKGDTTTYYDGNSKEVLFKYISGGPRVYNSEDGTFKPLYPDGRVELNYSLYTKMNTSIPNLHEYFKKWFTKIYGKEVNRISNHIS